MSYRRLKWVRVVVALIFFVLVTLCFLTFSRKLSVLQHILHLQFVPSVLAASGVGLATMLFTLLMTLVFGRVYCSWICPLGIWQDIVSRISRHFRKKAKFSYRMPHTALRRMFFGIAFLPIIFGILYPVMLLDPYSVWGRSVQVLFSPLLGLFTNLTALIFPDAVSYSDLAAISLGTFLIALASFSIVTILSALRGRLYCNTICPVGALLGAVSRVSLFRPVMDSATCISCGKCSRGCKSECIDFKSKTIDSSRCVQCYDCMVSCPKGSIAIAFSYGKKKPETAVPENGGRRDALIALGTVAAAGVANHLIDSFRMGSDSEIKGVLPPGAVSLEHLQNNCTRCYACVASCPSKIISYAGGEYGLNGLFLPVLKYEHGFCNFDCHKCSDACPAGALVNLTVEQKRRTQVGRAEFTAKNCIVIKDGTDCGACDEHCPTKAITMVEMPGRTDGLRYPQVNQDICIGCGACEYICPAEPVKAMKIIPQDVHRESMPPKVEKQEEVTVDDFGF